MLQKGLILLVGILSVTHIFALSFPVDSLVSEKNSESQFHNGFEYKRPKPFTFIKHLPGNVWDYSKQICHKDQLPDIVIMTLGTVALVAIDQPIVDEANKIGDQLHLSHENRQYPLLETTINISGSKQLLQLNVPYDATTTMYFLGDGITHFSIAGAFWLTGLAIHDYRALQTSSQLVESILTTGFVVQLLKHISGRESPFTSTAPGGKWYFLPDQVDYAKHTPNYDAFPSGHLATAMATVTVIASNYEEYHFIRPLGYSLMGLLGYAMLNNGVHWASDYPLGIALGYAFAKIAVNKGRSATTQHSFYKKKTVYNRVSSGIKIAPGLLFTGDFGMKLNVKF